MGYELKSARYLAREVILQALLPGDTAVDATMGNGHDTLTLCEAVGPAGHVFAFDVQEQAVEETKKRLREQGVDGRAELIRAGHEHMAEYVKGPVKTVVFNLGWLPGGDHGVTTRWETTRRAVESALDLLAPAGVVVICAYPGHAEGERERQELKTFLSGLPNRQYNVLHQRFLNAGAGAPECFVIQKQNET
ncbi:MAG: methyltransferase domain-containing protein [Clostridiales bacterium]|nr:methyltransferase domain-containing protein [Clostridiales bacterium]